MRKHLSPISRRRSLHVSAVVCLLALGSAHAQVKTPVPTPGGKDYSKGFQAFYALGLPDAAKAEYVNVRAYRNAPGMDMSGMYELQLQGNGWMLEETPKVKGRFIVGNCQVMEIYDQEALVKEQQQKWEEVQKTNKTAQVAMMEPWGQDEGRTPGQWKKVDAKKDIDKILSFLKKKGEKAERHDSMSYGNAYGTLFLSTIHFHRRGFTNEANEIVGLLFQSAGDPRKVISQGMDILASSRYNESYDAFLKNGDWQALGKDIGTLLTTFATSWKMGPAAKRLAERVKQRMAQPQPPPVTGADLTDEDKALALELATAKPSSRNVYDYYGDRGQLWILPLPTPTYRRPGPSMDDTNVVSRIKKRGLLSVPLLLALLKDDYLTGIDMQYIRGFGGHSYYYSNGDDAMSEERITQMYDAMSRPASRSDIAFALLNSLPPRKDEDMQRREGPVTRDELAEECKTWYEANKAKPPLEIARLYFLEGGREQQRAAMLYLVKKGAEADMEAIEKHFLDSPHAAMDSGAVMEYVQARGEKAKAFLAKYEAKLDEKSDGGEEMFNDKNVKRMLKEQLKRLKSVTTFKPPKELLAEVAAGTKTTQEIYEGLYQGLAKEKPVAALTLILDAALQAKDAGACRDLIGVAPTVGQLRGMVAESADEAAPEETEPGKPDPLQIASHAEQWKKLLADKRPIDAVGGTASTVGDIAARTIDAMYAQDEAMMSPYAARPKNFTALGRRTQAIYRARAEALLAGKTGDELPKFPSLDDIKDEQKKAAVDKIMKTPDASLEQAVSGLTLNEVAALTLAAPKDTKLNAKLAPVANKVRNVNGDAALAADLKDLESAKGKVLGRDTAEKLLALCRKLTAAGRVVRCSAVRNAGLDGIDVSVREVKPDSTEYKALIDCGALGGTDPKADVSGTVGDSACQGTSVWPLDTAAGADAGKKAAPAAVTEDDKLIDAAIAEVEARIKSDTVRDQGDFWKVVDDFCAGKGNVCGSGMIFFSGTPAIKTPPKAEAPKPETTKSEATTPDAKAATDKVAPAAEKK